MPISWSLKSFKIKDLKDYHKNPRKLTDTQYVHLKTSLDKFGLIDKPICTKEGVLIGGHQRIKVLKKDGIKEVDCWVPDRELEPKDIEELNIRLNGNSGSFDWDILANQFLEADLKEWGLDMTFLDVMNDVDDVEEKSEEKQKKLKMCPSCGHEF